MTWQVIGYAESDTPEPGEEVFALDGDGLLWRRFNDGVWSAQVDGVDQDTSWSDLLHNPAGLTLLRRVDPGVYQVIVEAPVIQAMGRDLFTTVADAVHEWAPEDRDGWDANVYASRAPVIPIAEDREEELQAQITEAISERQQTEVARDMARTALDQRGEQVHYLRWLVEEARWQRDQAEEACGRKEERITTLEEEYLKLDQQFYKAQRSARLTFPIVLPTPHPEPAVEQRRKRERLELEMSAIRIVCEQLNGLTRPEAQRVLAAGRGYISEGEQEVPY